jgi:hypothetical protein
VLFLLLVLLLLLLLSLLLMVNDTANTVDIPTLTARAIGVVEGLSVEGGGGTLQNTPLGANLQIALVLLLFGIAVIIAV